MKCEYNQDTNLVVELFQSLKNNFRPKLFLEDRDFLSSYFIDWISLSKETGILREEVKILNQFVVALREEGILRRLLTLRTL